MIRTNWEDWWFNARVEETYPVGMMAFDLLVGNRDLCYTHNVFYKGQREVKKRSPVELHQSRSSPPKTDSWPDWFYFSSPGPEVGMSNLIMWNTQRGSWRRSWHVKQLVGPSSLLDIRSSPWWRFTLWLMRWPRNLVITTNSIWQGLCHVLIRTRKSCHADMLRSLSPVPEVIPLHCKHFHLSQDRHFGLCWPKITSYLNWRNRIAYMGKVS